MKTIAIEALPLVSWKQLARDCLSGGDYLLWKSFHGQCELTANISRAQNILITFSMSTEKGNHRDLDNLLNFNVVVYAQLGAAAKCINYLALESKQKNHLR